MLTMRTRILELVPTAEEVVSYGMPAFRITGGVVAGLNANKTFVGYYPFSGSILMQFPKELADFPQTKSALHVPIGKPLSKSLLRLLLRARSTEIAATRAPAQRVSRTKSEQADFWKSLGISAPARRALEGHGIATLKDLRRWTEADLAALHGMGPHATTRIKAAMDAAGVRFKASQR